MRLKITVALAIALLRSGMVAASSILFANGAIIAFDHDTESLQVIRNGSVLVTDDRVTAVVPGFETLNLPEDTETIDITDKIITTGFIDTHRHSWQTVYKTLGSNTSLAEYFFRYGPATAGAVFTADDVYISQLMGLYEALNAGVTTILDHAHHTWSSEAAEAGLSASIDSGARILWSYALMDFANYTFQQQVQQFRDFATKAPFEGSPTTLGIAFDGWGPIRFWTRWMKYFNISVITSHSLQGPWGISNSPEDVHFQGMLNTSIPIVFSHASFLTANGARLLRSANQHISITPESEMHYGHLHPHNHLVQDQAALGVDTHFTFSTDILTQARIWLQKARYTFYEAAMSTWRIPRNNPMSVNQAFLLGTRNGALASRRSDIGVLSVGAKADLVVWNGRSPAMLGWTDPVAAVIPHASVGDIDHVLVDGQFKKRDGKIVAEGYVDVQDRFLDIARRIQEAWRQTPLPEIEGRFGGIGGEFTNAETADVQRGDGDGYGPSHV